MGDYTKKYNKAKDAIAEAEKALKKAKISEANAVKEAKIAEANADKVLKEATIALKEVKLEALDEEIALKERSVKTAEEAAISVSILEKEAAALEKEALADVKMSRESLKEAESLIVIAEKAVNAAVSKEEVESAKELLKAVLAAKTTATEVNAILEHEALTASENAVAASVLAEKASNALKATKEELKVLLEEKKDAAEELGKAKTGYVDINIDANSEAEVDISVGDDHGYDPAKPIKPSADEDMKKIVDYTFQITRLMKIVKEGNSISSNGCDKYKLMNLMELFYEYSNSSLTKGAIPCIVSQYDDIKLLPQLCEYAPKIFYASEAVNCKMWDSFLNNPFWEQDGLKSAPRISMFKEDIALPIYNALKKLSPVKKLLYTEKESKDDLSTKTEVATNDAVKALYTQACKALAGCSKDVNDPLNTDCASTAIGVQNEICDTEVDIDAMIAWVNE
jgi:hypothetical protein